MPRPTARVLALLEILQTGGTHTASSLAARLDVDERTVRRYLEHLLDLEIPVWSERGRYGGYRLAPGYRMPPLMFTDDEAVAVALGLVVARRAGLVTSTAAAVDAAAAKVRRVLPDELGRRLDALVDTTAFTAPDLDAVAPEADVLLTVAEAARARHPLSFAYTDRNGRSSQRVVHPFGIVAHNGRWYVTGRDVDRRAMRDFRADRIRSVEVRSGSFELPDGFDPVDQLLTGLAETPWRYEVSVRVQAPADEVRSRLPTGIATVRSLPRRSANTGWVRVRLRAERLDWVPPLLASLDRPFVIEEPEDLRDEMRAFAARLESYATEAG